MCAEIKVFHDKLNYRLIAYGSTIIKAVIFFKENIKVVVA